MKKRKRCFYCKELSFNWQKVNGSPAHCYDGCYFTTGKDWRTVDGKPYWEGGQLIKKEYSGALGLLMKGT